jgi:DNA-binding SARP family transcriptional activator/WD40 repeat protein
MMLAVEVQLLGPVSVCIDARPADLGGPRQRRLLGVLALRAGHRVDSDEIVDAVWAEGDLPDAPRDTLRTYVSRLRNVLQSPDRLPGLNGGYVLAIEADAVDAIRFESLVESALVEHGSTKIALLRIALALWHGPALAGFEHEEWARAHAVRLNERRAFAVDELADTEIELGRHEHVLADLQAAAADQPLRERTHRLLMQALNRSGRTAEALRVYQAYRRRLATDLGLEPGAEIRRLEQRISAEESGSDDSSSVRSSSVRGYELHERIGEGSFSVVYRGWQPAVERDVAVKQIRAELANRPDFIRRFEAEAHLVARLEHPHIVPLYDYWREPGSAYLVMRWLRGGSLESSLARGPLGFDRTLVVADQVGAALAAAHRAGVIHRDVKPANVLLDDIGNAYLSDFGIARSADVTHHPADSSSIGSPAYAPPEQLRREPVDKTVDIFGLGVVVFECLTGRLPFAESRDAAELLHHQLEDLLPSVTTWRPEMPTRVDQVLARATAKRPSDRHRTVEEFTADLRSAFETAAAPEVRAGAGTATAVPDADNTNPYKGLRAFDEADAAVFHGRDRLISSLVARLGEPDPSNRLLALVGPSGSGKSSALRAGLVPALRRGAIPGSDRWYFATMVPGASPYDEICTALLSVAVESHVGLGELARSGRLGVMRAVQEVLGRNGELILVIDQFEELFTQLADETERANFLAALAEAITGIGSQLRVLVTLRADFYDRPLRYPSVARLMSGSTVVVAPLAPDELESAITLPASANGVVFEPGLVAELVADVGSQPGALPLLQYALTELFDSRVGNAMTLDSYRTMGGLTGAIAARAEQMYASASAATQLAIRRVMRRLVSLGEGSEDTRRRVHRSELAPDLATDDIITEFGRARLLSFDRDPNDRGQTVEVAHEALIRQWPRLREWVSDDRAGLRVHRQLTDASKAWLVTSRDDGELFRGVRLVAAEEWVSANRAELNINEAAFFDASLGARDAEVAAATERWDEKLRQHRRLRRLLVAAVAVAVLALLAGGFAVQQRSKANDRATAANASAFEAETSRLSADAAQLVATNRRVALLLASEAYRRDPGPATLGTLQRVLTHTGELLGYMGGTNSYRAVTWLGTSRVAAARSDAVDIFAIDGNLERSLNIVGVNVLAFDAESTRLAAGANDAVTVVRLDDPTAAPIRIGRTSQVQAIAFGSTDVIAIGDRTGSLALVDMSTGSELRTIAVHPEQTTADFPGVRGVVETIPHVPASAARGVLDIAFDSASGRMATGGFGYARVWNPATGERVGQALLSRSVGDKTLIAAGRGVSFGTGNSVVVADESVAWTFDTVNGRPASAVPHAERGSYLYLAGAFVVEVQGSTVISTLSETVGNIATVDGSRVTTHNEVNHGLGVIAAIGESPDGGTVAFVGEGGIGLFSSVGKGLISDPVPVEISEPSELFVTPDGLTFGFTSVANRKTSVFRWDDSSLRKVALEPRGVWYVFSTPDPNRLIAAAEDGFYIVDAVNGRTIAPFEDWTSIDGGVPYFERQHPDLVVLANYRGQLRVHSMTDGSLKLRVDSLAGTSSNLAPLVAIAPDLSFALFSNRRGVVARIDLATGSMQSIEAGDVTSLTFSPDPKTIVTGRSDGRLTERHLDTFQPTGRQFIVAEGEDGEVGTTFLQDGRVMMTAGNARTQLWDWASGQRIGDPFPAEQGWGATGTERWLIDGLGGGPVRWSLDLDAWPDIACRAAGRNLTPDEWRQFGPKGTLYAATCKQFPSLDATAVET